MLWVDLGLELWEALVKVPVGWLAAMAATVGCGGPAFTAGSSDAGRADSSDAEVGTADVISRDARSPNDADATDSMASGCTCYSAAPSGWSGPGEGWTGTTGQTAPPCGSGFVAFLTGNEGLIVPSNDCVCACGAATGQKCTGVVTADYFPTTGCTVSLGGTQNVTTTCTPVNNVAANAVTVSSPPPTLGSCMSTTSGITTPTWTAVDSACLPAAPAQGGCGAGNVCVPPMGEGFQGICIWQAGDLPCPKEYSNRRVSFAGFSDPRVCGACTCGPPTGGVCDITLGLGSSCMVDVSNAVGCVPLDGATNIVAAQNPSGGACAPSGGGVSGSAVPTLPTTFCCMQ
jgi:hypothetical protein